MFISEVSGLWGVLLILVFHGLVSSGLFIIVGAFGVAVGGRRLILMLGVVEILRFMGVVIFILLFLNIGFPVSFGFLGEIEMFKSMRVSRVG